MKHIKLFEQFDDFDIDEFFGKDPELKIYMKEMLKKYTHAALLEYMKKNLYHKTIKIEDFKGHVIVDDFFVKHVMRLGSDGIEIRNDEGTSTNFCIDDMITIKN